MPKKEKPLIIGANQVSLKGPGTLVHEGGNDVLIADLKDGLPQEERALVFAGEEVVIDGDDEFQPADSEDRSTEIGEAAIVRSLGQANVTFLKKAVKKDPDPIAA